MVSSRQKSCSACVRGKRRCDLGFPQCGRCLAKRATCVYAWMSPKDAQEIAKSSDVIVWNSRADTTEASQSNHGSFRPEVGHENNDISLFPTPITLPPPLVPLVDEITGRGRTISLFTPDPYPQSSNQPYPDTHINSHTLHPATDIGTSLVPLRGSRGSSVYKGKTFRERAEYAASRLVHQVSNFAETGQTCFIHYSQISSSSLRDAFAACSLHTTRNSANASLVVSEIARRAELLIKATNTAISLSPPNSHSTMNLDLLPSTQAMLIYQTMRLFSTDDNPQRIQAEQDAKSLAKWVDILQAQTSEDSCSNSKLGLSWEDWIRVESIQRTMIFAELLESTYTFLKFGWYQPSLMMANLGFTGQGAIWKARSLVEWQQTREQKAWLRLDMSTFHDCIKGASLEHLDELGIILLVSYEGVGVLKNWAGGDKRLLEKWGLSSSDDFFSWPY
jgi:hypothetical protein